MSRKGNRILAGLVFVAAISAAITDHEEKNHYYPTWRYMKGVWEGERIQYISASHLADLLFTREMPLLLLDVRESRAYQEYHIPTARPFKMGGKLPGIDLADQIILYGRESDSIAIDLAVKIPGNVSVLRGGIEAWYQLVLFPDFVEYPVRNGDFIRHIDERSKFFGGSPKHIQDMEATQRGQRFREGC